MPVPKEYTSFFTNLVDKSRKSEINWEATAQPHVLRVRFNDFSIKIWQENGRPASVHIQLLNDQGEPAVVMSVSEKDEEWLGAVGLINSAERDVRKIGRTMQRAMEELGKKGRIGLEARRSTK